MSHTIVGHKRAAAAIVTCSCGRTQVRSYRGQKLCTVCSPPRESSWPEIAPPAPAFRVWFSMPLSGAFSKNRMHSLTRDKSGVVTRKSAREIMDAIAWNAKLSLGTHRLEQAKVWLEIVVEKTQPLQDAVNVVDIVCDGVKRGIGVDDRYFAIARLEWQLVHRDPRIFIAISQ